MKGRVIQLSPTQYILEIKTWILWHKVTEHKVFHNVIKLFDSAEEAEQFYKATKAKELFKSRIVRELK